MTRERSVEEQVTQAQVKPQCNEYVRSIWCKKKIHRGSFTHRRFYTQTLLHTDAFTHRLLHTQTLLHKDVLSHRRFYTHTHTFLHTNSFTHRPFCTKTLLHTNVFIFLHTDALRTDTFRHRGFDTERLDTQTRVHTDAFTHRGLRRTHQNHNFTAACDDRTSFCANACAGHFQSQSYLSF